MEYYPLRNGNKTSTKETSYGNNYEDVIRLVQLKARKLSF